MQAKVWERLSFLDYRKLPGFNASLAVKALESMLELQHAIEHPEQLTSDMVRIGTALHSLAEFSTLDQFLQLYTVMPDYHLDPDNVKTDGSRSYEKTTTWYKAKVKEFKSQNQGNVIAQEDYDKVRGMLSAMLSKSSISKLLDGSHREISIQAEMRDVLCKARLDGIKKVSSGLFDCFDIKSTAGSIHRKTFGRIMANQEYIWKLAFYRAIAACAGIRFRNLYLLVVSQSPPHDCARVPIHATVLDQETQSVIEVLDRYRELKDTKGRWPGVDEGADDYEVEIPLWYMREKE